MKKIASWTSVLLVFSLVVQIFVAPIAFAAETTGTDYERKTVTAYIYCMDDTTKMDCLFYKDNPHVAYIDPADYIKPLFMNDVVISETKNNDGTYTITKDDTHMIVDPARDTVYFDRYEIFAFYNLYGPEGEAKDAPYIETEPGVLPASPAGVKLELAPYGMDIREADGKVYLPMPTIADILAPSYLGGQYYNGSIYYELLVDMPYYDKSAKYNSTDRDPSLVDYTYNELCFVMDYFYGRPQNAEVSTAMSEMSFDKMLDTFSEDSIRAKKLLKSENIWDYYGGLGILECMFLDGGHSIVTVEPSVILLNTYPDTLLAREITAMFEGKKAVTGAAVDYVKGFNARSMASRRTRASVRSTRESRLPGYDIIKTWPDDIQAVRDGDTILFIFNSFEDEVVKYFKWTLDYAKKKGVKNFIIDLALNSGGSEGVLDYILGMITNKKNHTNRFLLNSICTLTGNDYNTTGLLDLNLDGKFNDADKDVCYDFNYAIMTSRNSFSCGNLLPVLAQEAGIPILGEIASGGECMISRCITPENGYIQYSGCEKFVNAKGIGVDGGAKPDFPLLKTTVDAKTGDKVPDYSGFYDLKNITKKVEKFYNVKKNPLKVTVRKTTVKAKDLETGKKTIQPLQIKNARGTVSVKPVKKGSSSAIFNKLKVNKKGTVTLKKGTYKSGTYKIVIRIKAAGNSKYKSATLTKTVRVKIK